MKRPSNRRHGDVDNNLLNRLSKADFALLEPRLQKWQGKAGEIIYEPGDPVQNVYFPCGPSLVSYLVVLEDGRGIETTLIGKEGAIGGIVSHGRLPAYTRAEIQFPGTFLRMSTNELEAAKHESLSLRHMFARYADCVMAQIFQSVACNAVHTIEQRAAKWLLGVTTRTGNQGITLTQEQLSAMLGVGRTYIGKVMHVLKTKGAIDASRGQIVIRDFDGLKSISCNCDNSVHNHFEDVLSGVYPDQSQAAYTAGLSIEPE